MWITLTADKIQTRLTGAELTAMRTAALAAGQSDPLPEIVATVVRLVRAKVAACANNNLGAGQTIPDELEAQAIAIARYYLADRLPVASLMTEARRNAYTDAMRLLAEAAACKLALEQPAEASEEEVAGPQRPRITPRRRQYRREDGDGS